METTRCFETAPEGSSLAACSLPAGHEGQHRAHFAHDPEGAFIEWSNEDCTTLRARAEQAERERDEARAEVERLRDRLQTAVDEQVSPHETLPAEELIAVLEHSLAEGRHERERLRGALKKAKGPIAIAASYADAPEVSVGLRVHARDCARILPEINAALAGEARQPTTIPVDVDLLGVKPVSRLPGGREFKVVVSSRAGAALAGEASGNGGPCQRCDGSGYEVDLYPDGSADREPCGTCNEKASQP